MKFTLAITLCLLSISTIAQTFRTQDHQMGVDIFLADYSGPKYLDVDGSPYLNDAYLPAKINTIEKTQFVRLNCADNNIEIKSGDGKVMVLDFENTNYEIKFSDGSNKKYWTYSYIDGEGKTTKSFFEIIGENERYRIFKKERKIFVPKSDVQGYAEKKPARFLAVDDDFYITDFKNGSNLLLEIPQKKRKFISFFSEGNRGLEKYIKEEKLDFKNEKDLTMIINFFFEQIKK